MKIKINIYLNIIFVILIIVLSITLLFSSDIKKHAINSKIISNKNSTSLFIEVSTDDIYSKISNNDTFYLYTGRDSCPYCQDIEPILQDAFDYIETDLYFLDSQNTENDVKIQEFRDNYNIEYVPSLIKFQNGTFSEINVNQFIENGTYVYEKLYDFLITLS